MLSEALRLPYRATDATGTLLVGSVLTGVTGLAVVGWLALLAVAPLVGAAVTPLVFLLSLIVRGYLLRVVAAGISDRAAAPSFVRWGSLLRQGMRSAVVSAVYFLPGAVFVGLAVGAGVATAVDPAGFSPALQAIAALAILVGGFGTLCYGLLYVYLRGAGRAILAATGSVRAALDVRRVLRLSASGSYLGGWLVAMGLLTVGPLLLTPLVVVSVLAGLYDPVLTAIGGLLTVVVAVVLVFSLRMSAAWATGRGAAAGLQVDGPAVDDGAIQPMTPTATVEIPERPPESPASVQVGRTVTAATASDDSNRRDSDDDRYIDFGMPEPTLPDGTGPTYSEKVTTDETSTDDEIEAVENKADVADDEADVGDDEADVGDDEADIDDETKTADDNTDAVADDSATAADEPEADVDFEWGVAEEK